jgi:hypothetical protein
VVPVSCMRATHTIPMPRGGGPSRQTLQRITIAAPGRFPGAFFMRPAQTRFASNLPIGDEPPEWQFRLTRTMLSVKRVCVVNAPLIPL